MMDRLLDNARTGPLYLRQPEIVVMANHVHLLITPLVPVMKITQSLKRFSAREANRILSLTGTRFWEEESYDRLVRDRTEFDRIARYIEWNPVKCGLVAEPREFPWSSARADYKSAAD